MVLIRWKWWTTLLTALLNWKIVEAQVSTLSEIYTDCTENERLSCGVGSFQYCTSVANIENQTSEVVCECRGGYTLQLNQASEPLGVCLACQEEKILYQGPNVSDLKVRSLPSHPRVSPMIHHQS